MSRAIDKAWENYPENHYSDNDEFDTNEDFRQCYIEGYEQAIADAKEWIEKNASKNIYINYDSTGFRGYWSQGLAKDLENNLIGES